MYRRTNSRSTTAQTIEFPAATLRRYPVPRPGNSHHATSASTQQPAAHNPFPDLTAGELSAILLDHLRADAVTRDKALAILQTIEAEQQKKAAAHVCPTCLRPLNAESQNNNSSSNSSKKGKHSK
jgi:hypothetical protein